MVTDTHLTIFYYKIKLPKSNYTDFGFSFSFVNCDNIINYCYLNCILFNVGKLVNY